MVKLCRTCGYINMDNALECEECHSLFDDKLDSIVNNDTVTNSSNEIDFEPSHIISLSDLLKISNEDVISDQSQYTPIDYNNTPSYTKTDNQELEYSNNKEESISQYVSDFLYSKNGESEDFEIEENQIIENNVDENINNNVSIFLYGKESEESNIYNDSSSSNIEYDEFSQISVSDILNDDFQSQPNTNMHEKNANEIIIDDSFDSQQTIENFLYDSDTDNNLTVYGFNNNEDNIKDHLKEVNDSINTESFLENNISTSAIEKTATQNDSKPLDVLYEDGNENKSASKFLYSIDDNKTNINILLNKIEGIASEEYDSNESNVLEEIVVSDAVTSIEDNIIYPADAVESEEIISSDLNSTYDENLNNNQNTDEFVSQDTIDKQANENNIEDQIVISDDVLEKDNIFNIKEYDTLSDDNQISDDEEDINHIYQDITLNEKEIIEEVNKQLADATYMENLDISNILSYSNDEEDIIQEKDIAIKDENTVESTKTGLLDTLKQIFSFTSTNSKELSKEEINKEYEKIDDSELNIDSDKKTENTHDNIYDSIIGEKNSTPIKPNEPKGSIRPANSNFINLSNIKPMEIRRKNTIDNVNKATEINDDDLEDALKAFESAGTFKKEEDIETVVYDLPSSSTTNNAKETEQSAMMINNKEKQNVLKKSKLTNKAISNNNHKVIKRSIIISAILACAVISIVVIVRINKEKEMNAYCARLAANNDISYINLLNGMLEKGYSEDDSFKSIEALNIDFSENALNIIYTVAKDSNKLSSKEDVRKILESKNFANSEIEKAMSIVEWDKYLTIYIEACISKTKELDKNTIIKSIQSTGFTNNEVEYIKKNVDWSKLAKKNLNTFLNNEELHTKDEAKAFLEEKGYSEKDIETTFKDYEWDVYAYQYLTKYLQKQEENGVSIESSRINYAKILEDAKFDEEEIELVMGRFDFASYATSKIDTLINDGGTFIDKSKVKESLEKEGYTEEEIEAALKDTDWNATAITSLKSLDNAKLSKKEMLQKLTDAKYDEKEIEYATKNYNWDEQSTKYLGYLRSQKLNGNEEHLRNVLENGGYTTEEINKLITSLNFEKNVDWFEEAAKEDLKSISNSDNFTKKKAEDYLTSLNYGKNEISVAIKSYNDWKTCARNYLNTIEINSRVEARENLKSEGFENTSESKEIDYAINEYSWGNKCISYATSLYEQLSDCEKYKEYMIYYNNKSKSTIYSALSKGEYTDNEIANALDHYVFSSTPAQPDGCTIN